MRRHLSSMTLLILLIVSSAIAQPSTIDCLGHKDSTSLTCVFGNACIEGTEITLFTDSDTGLPDVQLGTYGNGPPLSSKILPLEAALSRNFINFTVCGGYQDFPRNYFHSLLDDHFGLWWMARFVRENRNLTCDFHKHLNQADSHWKIDVIPSITSSNCFEKLVVGPGQHHFGGPGHYRVTGGDLVEFRDHLISRHLPPRFKSARFRIRRQVSLAKKKRRRVGVIFRRSSRRILNFNALMLKLREVLGREARVEKIEFEEMGIGEQIEAVRGLDALVGMHGAGLTNLIFLRPSAVVIELFPFEVYRPIYQKLAGRLGVGYFSWRNAQRENTVLHDSHLQGGSAAEIDDAIRDPESVTRTLIGNAYWLGQDTIVNCGAVSTLVTHALSSSSLPPRIEEVDRNNSAIALAVALVFVTLIFSTVRISLNILTADV